MMSANHLSTGLAIGFPFYVWFLGWEHPSWIALYLLATGLLKLRGTRIRTASLMTWALFVIPIILGLLTLFQGSHAGLYYPVTVSLSLLLLFSASLLGKTNIIQRIAEKTEQPVTGAIDIRYTRMVTMVWCVFFIVNAAISFFLAWHQIMDWWAWYNGVISYVLIGILLAGERLLRPELQRKIQPSR